MREIITSKAFSFKSVLVLEIEILLQGNLAFLQITPSLSHVVTIMLVSVTAEIALIILAWCSLFLKQAFNSQTSVKRPPKMSSLGVRERLHARA